MKSIAIITARSGSKGLPDKNILPLNRIPLIAYTIKAAIDSNCFDEVMVSTDSEKYADIAKEYGANVPFLRSENNSSDSASSWDTVREVLNNYSRLDKQFDYVALLQPTSPLRNADDISNCFKMLNEQNKGNVISVTEVEHPVQWCFTMPDDLSMNSLANSPYSNKRRQELETHYVENGAIYLVDARKIMSKDYNIYADNCHGYIMPRTRSVDIDSALDFKIVEAIISA